MRIAALFLLTAGLVDAGQSVMVTGGYPRLSLPDGSPWRTIGSRNQPMRWEMRLTHINNTAYGGNYPGFTGEYGGPLVGTWQARANGNLQVPYYILENGGMDKFSTAETQVSVSSWPTQTDLLIRVQRDVSQFRYTLEVCATVTNDCWTKPYPLAAFGPDSWAGLTFALGTSASAIDFLRWYSDVVPVGTPIPVSAPRGDIADWEFEGTLVDSVHGLRFSEGAVAFVQTPVYRPACNPGKSQAFRAGFPAQLDGSASMPLDGGTALTYQWRQLPGVSPLEVVWTDPQSRTPRIDGLVFGSYNFELTVRDGSGQTSACTVHDGAVATDDNGVVIQTDPVVQTLLGPLVRLGAHPWPWFDDRHRAMADMQVENLVSPYQIWFDTPLPGTVKVTKGSAEVVGTGTHFLTDFCDPNRPNPITIWYPTNIPQNPTGRRLRPVASCTDDTHLTLGEGAWPDRLQDGSGLQYSNATSGKYFSIQGAPSTFDYYDNALGLYALYYRSGIDTYLIAGRRIADEFYRSPQLDMGTECHAWIRTYTCWWNNPLLSLTGVMVRAHDNPPYDYFPTLHGLWDRAMDRMSLWEGVESVNTKGINSDVRSVASEVLQVSFCALYDSDPAYQARCRSALSGLMGGYFARKRDSDGGWKNFFGDFSWYHGNGGPPWPKTGSPSASVINGSRTVAGNGTAWSCDLPNGCPVWFLPDPNTPPMDNSSGDPVYYVATVVDGTHILLDRPYEGATNTLAGWAIGNSSGDYLLGLGAQPFMEGILAAAFDFAAKALENSDPVNAALAQGYVISAANWVRTHGYKADTKGLYYGAGTVNCPKIALDRSSMCTTSDGPSARTLQMEGWRGLQAAYVRSGDPSLKSWLDEMFNAVFAKPGTCPKDSTVCVPDGIYMDPIDGGYMVDAGDPKYPPKWFGAFFGFGATAAWAAYRIGGAQPAQDQDAYITFHLGDHENAARARAVVMEPSGAIRSFECAGSPCLVKVDARQGKHPALLQFLSAGGTVVATQKIPILVGR